MSDDRTGIMTSEPAVVTGGLMGAFGAFITALNAFDLVTMTADQVAALAGVAVIILPLVQGLVTRRLVRPAKLSISAPSAGGDHLEPPTPVTGQ